MILQALVEYYELLQRNASSHQGNDIPHFGWSNSSVSGCVQIDSTGKFQSIIPLFNEKNKNRIFEVPLQLKRSGKSPTPYFLCDSIIHMLGIEGDTVTERSLAYFQDFKTRNLQILSGIACNESIAICQFLRTWNPATAILSDDVMAALTPALAKGNLVFRIGNTWALDSPAIVNGWNSYYENILGQESRNVCLVTGKTGPIARIHNSVKGIYANTPSPNGWTLVGFDKGSPAFSSYGKSQGFNAPVSQYAAFAYTTALNHLLADRDHVCRVGDATVVYWAKNGSVPAQNIMGGFCFGQPTTYSENDLFGLVQHLCRGDSVTFEEEKLDPNMEFYVLGLSPNAARLSVRFFLRNSLGSFLRNTMEHHRRMEIVRPAYDKFQTLPLWKLLDETVNQNSRDKSPAPNLAGETLRAILSNTPYPAALLNGVRLRIRAEREITRGRAAIMKAYYLKNTNSDVPKEVLTVSLNPDSTSIPYTLGRLFSVLEAIQSSASPGLNATIKDRYFNSASSSPAHVFPTLINLAQKHLKKIGGGLSVYYDKQLTELMAKLDENYPSHLSIPQQGVFQLGYYHQTQARYEAKNKEEN